MDLLQKIEKKLSRWTLLGVKRTANGGQLIAPLRDCGPNAFLHKLLPPLSEVEIEEVEDQLYVQLSSQLAEFYRHSNGACFYNIEFDIDGYKVLSNVFSVYGLRKIYRSGTIEDLLEQPFDVVLENEVDGWAIANQAILVSKYSGDNSRVYINKTGSVVRVLEGSILSTWSSFDDWILDELDRLDQCFDTSGRLLVRPEETPPPNRRIAS